MFLALVLSQLPVLGSKSPISHSVGMLWPTGVLLRAEDPPHCDQFMLGCCAATSPALESPCTRVAFTTANSDARPTNPNAQESRLFITMKSTRLKVVRLP